MRVTRPLPMSRRSRMGLLQTRDQLCSAGNLVGVDVSVDLPRFLIELKASWAAVRPSARRPASARSTRLLTDMASAWSVRTRGRAAHYVHGWRKLAPDVIPRRYPGTAPAARGAVRRQDGLDPVCAISKITTDTAHHEDVVSDLNAPDRRGRNVGIRFDGSERVAQARIWAVR
jgi:hypothetical protein